MFPKGDIVYSTFIGTWLIRVLFKGRKVKKKKCALLLPHGT